MNDKKKKRGIEPWRPFRDLVDFRDIFDKTLNEWNLLPYVFGKTYGDTGSWYPAVDIIDKKDKILVKAELPGLEKDNIKVSLDNDRLILSGEKKTEEKTEDKDYYHCERSYGAFYRAIDLPVSVDPGKVKASYKEGLLEITLPKIEGERGQKEIRIE